MNAALGRDSVTIGSAPDNDVVVCRDRGWRRITPGSHGKTGRCFSSTSASARLTANGVPVAPQQPVPFDFRTEFAVGGVPVPLAHPAIAAMLMSAGQLQAPRGARHRRAGSGSRVARHRPWRGQRPARDRDARPPDGRRPRVDERHLGRRVSNCRPISPPPSSRVAIVAFGPVPVPVSVLAQVAQRRPGPPRWGRRSTARRSRPPAPPCPPRRTTHPRKHRTVIGELSLDQLQRVSISIGRTPDNQIVVNHPQVSSRHAQIVKVGRKALSGGPGQRERHVRARPETGGGATRARPERREGLRRPHAAIDSNRATAASTSSSRTRSTGRVGPFTR